MKKTTETEEFGRPAPHVEIARADTIEVGDVVNFGGPDDETVSERYRLVGEVAFYTDRGSRTVPNETSILRHVPASEEVWRSPYLVVSDRLLREIADRIAEAYRGPGGLKMSVDDVVRIVAAGVGIDYDLGYLPTTEIADAIADFEENIEPGQYSDDRYWTDGEANGLYSYSVLVGCGAFGEKERLG